MDRKRKHNFNNINRNRSYFNNIKSKFSRDNVVAPEMLVSHVWMQDEDTNGVEIIELNSSNDSGSLEDQPTFSQAWDCVDNRRFRHVQDDYQINDIARENRRLRNHENPFLPTYDSLYYIDTQPSQNGHFKEHVTDFRDAPIHHQTNCFTIINNHVLNSDSSSEHDYAGLGGVQPEDCNNPYWDHVYTEDRPRYDTNTGEKRTIWIYSFKNRHLLSEDNFELTNIQSSEMLNLSSSSSPSDEANDKSNDVTRIRSPIAPIYIPRLNLYLGKTLPTVAEIPEVKLTELEEKQRHINSWLTDRREKVNVQNDNVINWMALSPRERRRRFKITEVTSDIDNNGRETTIYMEGNHNTELKIRDTPKRVSSSKVQVDVDVHAIYKEVNTIEEFSHNTIENPQKSDTYVISSVISEETIPEITDNKPRINPKSSSITKSTITSPIQKLDSNNWIVEENVKKESKRFIYDDHYNKKDNQNEKENNNTINNNMDEVSKRLYAKSMKFVRASEWNAFIPIAGLSNSLHLSISCSTLHEKRTWFQKLCKYFKCCR